MGSMYQLNQIPSEAQIKKYLRRIVFGKNVFCPRCKARNVKKEKKRYWCPRCRRRFTLLSYTWLKGMKLSYEKFWVLLWAWTSQLPVKQAMALARLSEEAVRRWYDAFRAHLPEHHVILQGIVQLDEAYGKGWALLMAKQEGSRKLAYTVFHKRSVDRNDAYQFLRQYVKPRSRLYTDGALIYRSIGKWWPVRHARDIHKNWEFGKTSEIEGIFGNFRTFVRRMYHHHWAENVEDYVREFSSRFSSPEMFKDPSNYLQKTLSLAPFD
jgi:transposase-like protein